MAKKQERVPGTPGQAHKPSIPAIFKKTEISPVMAALSIETIQAEGGEPFKVGQIMMVIPGEMIIAEIGPEAIEQFRNELNSGIDVTSVMPPALTRV
jgi:hypothetical protein